MPGVGHFTATALACRVGRVERFPRSHSLANYWGLTPGCRNSGENNQRLGSITKAGSSMARWLLAQVVHQGSVICQNFFTNVLSGAGDPSVPVERILLESSALAHP